MSADYWMTAPGCGGALTMLERLEIRKIAQQQAALFGNNFRAVNIGVDKGGTLWCIRAGAPACELIGVDIDPDSEPGDWQLIHGDSRRAHSQIETDVHLLLIDGDHSYYGVKADIINWTPKLPVNGAVIFHDYGLSDKYPWTAGVRKAVDELMDEREWATIDIADSIKAFRKIEGKTQ